MTDAHDLGGFVDGKTAEELQFDNSTLLRVQVRQLIERFIQRQQIDHRLRNHLFHARNRKPLLLRSTALFSLVPARMVQDRKSTRLNSSHGYISYAVFCLKKKTNIM